MQQQVPGHADHFSTLSLPKRFAEEVGIGLLCATMLGGCDKPEGQSSKGTAPGQSEHSSVAKQITLSEIIANDTFNEGNRLVKEEMVRNWRKQQYVIRGANPKFAQRQL